MTLYKKRERFQGFSAKVGNFFSKFGLSPNQWTVITLIPALITMYFLIKQDFLLAAVFFIITAFIDIIDGSVARVAGKATKLGAYLDTIVDRYVEAIIVFGLIFASLPNFYIPAYAWIFLYFLGSFMTTYAKSAASEKGLVKKELRGGLLERADRMLLLFVGFLAAILNPLYLTYIIVLLAVLTNISALQRIYTAIRSRNG